MTPAFLRTHPRFLAATALALAAAATLAVHAADDKAATKTAGPAQPALTVTTTQPQRATLGTAVNANGNVAAWQEAIVGAEVNGARLAERCGIDVVCDFRSRDLAAGGQGAPLVPAFHAALFGQPGHDHALLNLGGIANLTLLHADGRVSGFDTGPANVLMDGWCASHRGSGFDEGGAWAAGGQVDAGLLERLLAEPYFSLPPPKSTGRDLFDMAWLEGRTAGFPATPQDVMATLSELTARTAAEALNRHLPGAESLHVCGGGAFNRDLLARLARHLPSTRVARSDALGVPPDQMEAMAFAWLARAFLERRPGNLPAVTGAAGPRVLGALYPAG